MAEDDGETEIVLGSYGSVDTDKELVFEGLLQTPNRKLVVRTVRGVTLLELPVPTTETKVMIWVNDSSEPDRIAVGVVR